MFYTANSWWFHFVLIQVLIEHLLETWCALLFVNYIFCFLCYFLFESYTYLKLCIVIDLILLAVDFDAIFMVSSFCTYDWRKYFGSCRAFIYLVQFWINFLIKLKTIKTDYIVLISWTSSMTCQTTPIYYSLDFVFGKIIMTSHEFWEIDTHLPYCFTLNKNFL